MRRALLLACLMVGLAAPAAPAALPPVRHVFVVVLENKDFDESFGPHSVAPYLSTQLTARGALLTQYFGTSHQSLGNYISMISGQAANPQTQADCPTFVDVVPGTLVGDGQALGQGCVYPKGVPTVADQLEARGLTWRGYMQSMTTPCRHPAIGMPDDTERAGIGDQYAVRHDPFVYFHSIIDDQARCERGVVDLRQLPDDLASAAKTPNLSFVVPDLCEDGHDEPCVDGRPGGLRSADDFLEAWIPASRGCGRSATTSSPRRRPRARAPRAAATRAWRCSASAAGAPICSCARRGPARCASARCGAARRSICDCRGAMVSCACAFPGQGSSASCVTSRVNVVVMALAVAEAID